MQEKLDKSIAELTELKELMKVHEEQIDQEEESEETKKDDLRGGSNLTVGKPVQNF